MDWMLPSLEPRLTSQRFYTPQIDLLTDEARLHEREQALINMKKEIRMQGSNIRPLGITRPPGQAAQSEDDGDDLRNDDGSWGLANSDSSLSLSIPEVEELHTDGPAGEAATPTATTATQALPAIPPAQMDDTPSLFSSESDAW